MILKKQVYRQDKKVNALIGVLLFSISVVLLAVTGPLGFVYGLFHSLFTRGFKGIGEYLLKIAISIDQLGNVMMQHLLNVLWTKKGRYLFGNRDETISSALGRNKKLNALSGFGRAVDKFLDAIDPNHTLNSIDYYIEPSEEMIDKVAWIHIVDGRILSTRSKGKEKYHIPSGKRDYGESDAEVLFREIQEELNVMLQLASLKFIGIFEAQADGHTPGVFVRMTCYSGDYNGKLLPGGEIEEMVWLNYENRDMIAEVDKLIFDFLKDTGDLL